MQNWIPFGEGEYLVEEALLVAPNQSAVVLEDAVIHIFVDAHGRRQLRGRSRVRNILMVELLEDNENFDIVLDLGETFKYRLRRPEIQIGKVFAPDIKSMLKFTPGAPWEPIADSEFEDLRSRLKIISG
ncbi:MAG: hypothetical protein JSW39_15010 [Desulfobacterales bacterium]|nr:MAG: hypothetical protein JSW39_15010 [Desulfobacterales bacterium]